MLRPERGVVVEARDRSALVRLEASAACAGCASAGSCRRSGEGGSRLVEARNAVGARPGEAVEVLVDAGSPARALARRWLPPLLGLLLGAAAGQALAAAPLGAEAAARAAGVGGIAGAAAGALLARALPAGGPAARPPEIARVLEAAAETPPR